MDVVDVDVDVDVNEGCRFGEMAQRITTKPGTMTGQIVTSSSSESWTVTCLHFLQRGRKRFDDQS